MRLVRPNTKPSIPPALGPSKHAPIITGICTVVAFIKPSGI